MSQMICIFATKCDIMASVEENILTAIKAKGRGSIFFPSDFTSYGEVTSSVWREAYIHILRLTPSWGLAY